MGSIPSIRMEGRKEVHMDPSKVENPVGAAQKFNSLPPKKPVGRAWSQRGKAGGML